MIIRINNGKMYLNLRESTTVADALRLLELTLCRELKRPLSVVLNKEMLTEGKCKFQKVVNNDVLEIAESVKALEASDSRFLVKSKNLTKRDMTRSAFLWSSLLRKELLIEYRRKIRG